MSLLGVRLTLLIGPTVAVPAPPPLIEALHEVEVTHRDDGQSGFSITFQIGRAGPAALMDYALANNPLLDGRMTVPKAVRALLARHLPVDQPTSLQRQLIQFFLIRSRPRRAAP